MGEHFAPARRSQLPAALRGFFVCEDKRILYRPIAKCACTSLKRTLVELSGIPHADLILEHGVHRVTDGFKTGLLLQDRSPAEARRILTSDDYYKFAVVREPVSRIISAYSEKFFLNRNNVANHNHTRAPLQAVRGEQAPDFHAGITFREFVTYLVNADPADLDSHWARQVDFLAGVNRYDDIFPFEEMARVAARLSELTGDRIELPSFNRSTTGADAAAGAGPGRYVDLSPAQLDEIGAVSPADFRDPDLVRTLRAYYCEDLALYEASRKGLSGYVPAAAAYDRQAAAKQLPALVAGPDIARCLNLYSHGYFALDESSHGHLRLIVANSGTAPCEFDAFDACYLEYVLRDDRARVLHPPRRQRLDLGRLPPGAVQEEMLHVHAPAALRPGVRDVVVSLLLGESCRVEDYAPLHIACARLIIG